MRFRKSRCVYVAVVVVSLHIIVFFMLQYSSALSGMIPRLKQLQYDFAGLAELFRPRDAYLFNAWANRLFDEVVAKDSSSGVKMAQFAVQDSPKDSVEIPGYLKGGENPHLVPFDPRFTLGMVLSDLSSQLEAGSTDLSLSTFHWADWTDLSIMHEHMLGGKLRARCDLLQSRDAGRRTQPDVLEPDAFCVDDDRIAQLADSPDTNPMILPYLKAILASPNRPGFHVHQHPGRANSKNMRLAGASYINDFMPAPMAILFLLPWAQKLRTLKVTVNQDVLARTRLIDTPVASLVAAKQEKLVVADEISRLSSLLPAAEDPESYVAEVALDLSMFQDPLQDMLKQLALRHDLTLQESNYFSSLALSLRTETVPKYFNEARLVRSVRNWGLGSHYDWRFYKGLINFSDTQLPVLHGLLTAWLRFTAANGLTTWVAHGLLLLWYWNGMVFPWDADIDVQMPVKDLHRLAQNFNQTVVVDFGDNPAISSKASDDTSSGVNMRHGRYFVDCATWISHRRMENGLNFIDARFIDLDSGLYIDITGLAISNTMSEERYDLQLPKEYARKYHFRNTKTNKHMRSPDEKEFERNTEMGLVNCRNNHFVQVSQLSPLTLTYVEGVPAYVPRDFSGMLQAEYGSSSIGTNKYRSYAFLPRLRLWQDTRVVRKHIKKEKAGDKKEVDMGSDAGTASSTVDKLSVFSFSDRDYLQFMAAEPLVLIEYLVTRDVTALHEKEMQLRLAGKDASHLFFDNGQLRHNFRQLRHDYTNFYHKKHDFDFSAQVRELQTHYDAYRSGKEVVEKLNTPADHDPVPVNKQTIKEKGNLLELQTPELAQNSEVTRPDQVSG